MTTTAGALAQLGDAGLRDEVERIAAAAGVRVIHVDPGTPVARKLWAAAGAVLLDGPAAMAAQHAGLPRRSDVFVVVLDDPDGDGADSADTHVLTAAIAAGASDVLVLPRQAEGLVRALSGITDAAGNGHRRGPVVAVVGGRGGAGASLFAAAMALSASGSLLIDLDPWSGGIDLLVGGENVDGLRWPDIAVRDGRLSWSAVREALPHHHGISVLSGSRQGHHIAAGAVEAVVDAGRSGGATVVCDLTRQLSAAARSALDAADLAVIVTSADVRSCAATAALAPEIIAVNPNVGLVIRGPSPGGLRPGEIAELIELPLLASMRPEPMIAERLERGGLRLAGRSPLAAAAKTVLAVLTGRQAKPQERAA